MTAIANLPDLRPSLLLDFANSGRVDPRIQCTRASSATCFGPDGKLRTVAANVPRIDYDPATGKCLGLLVEEARTNLFTYSADLSNSAWSKSNLTVGASMTLSGLSFTKLEENTQNGGRNARRMLPSSLQIGTAVSFRWYLAEGSRRFCNVLIAESGGAVNSIGLDTKTGEYAVKSDSLAGWSWNVKRWPSGVIEVTAANASLPVGYGAGSYIDIRPTTYSALSVLGAVGQTYVGEVGQHIYVGPIQFELGAFPTSYIPTEASAVARAADQVFIEGLAFTGAMSFVQGAVLCSYTARSAAGNQIVLQARSASANLGFAFQFTAAGGARNRALIDDGSGSPPNFSTRSVEAGVKYRAGLSWAPGTASNVVSGGFISTVTQPINISTPQRLGLGHNGFGANYFNGHIHDLSLYAGYIQPAQLQRLTA